MTTSERFRYAGFDVDAGAGALRCRYEVDGVGTFEERVGLGPGRDWDQPAALEAARLVFLLAGVSYYKVAAPPVVDLGETPLRPGEAAFLRTFLVDGLGEFAYRNGLDLGGLVVVGGTPVDGASPASPVRPGRPLVPFGGGIDSIVAVEEVRRRFPETALFVVSRAGDRFAAIEDAAAAAGLPVVRADRAIDPAVLASYEHGYLTGHVPVTGILSAIAVLAAVLDRRDAVVMANEWSASIGNIEVGGRSVNHQWSKSLAFERDLRAVLAGAFAAPPGYFSLLRSRSELWVAQRFAGLERYHHVFRSCNRAFTQEPAARLDAWCGRCDKCCFIDLILAPFMSEPALRGVFGGREPLADPSLAESFRALLGLSPSAKPFECVGDVGECRAAVALAARRPDRSATTLLHELARQVPVGSADGAVALLRPLGPDHVPAPYASEETAPDGVPHGSTTDDLLV